MNAVGLAFGVSAAVAFAIAYWGPNQKAKWIAGYLVASWAVSNGLFVTQSPDGALQGFAYMDCFAAAALFVVWLSRPSAWLGVVVAALYSQLTFNALHHFGISIFESEWIAYFINDFLFAVQIVAVTLQRFSRSRPRSSVDRARRNNPRPPRRRMSKLRLVVANP